MLLYLAGRLAIVVLYYLVRLVPVVGLKLSDRYEHGLFGPLVDDVSVVGVRAGSSDGHPASTVVELELENGSSLDAGVVGGNVRLGLSREGGTVYNFLWDDDLGDPPKNVRAPKVEAEGRETVELECVLPPAPDDGELWLDGALRFRRVLTYRETELPLGKTTFPLDERSFSVASEPSDGNGEAEAGSGPETAGKPETFPDG